MTIIPCLGNADDFGTRVKPGGLAFNMTLDEKHL